MLKDARGYRSPYINALNGAVAAARVVGGDVIPEETPSGTLLTIAQTRRAGRFELFCGYDNGGSSGADAFCLSDGTLYVAAVAQDLKPGREVFRRDGDLQPRANGWCTRKTITDGQTLTFACVRYAGEYYLIAQKDGESASALLPEAQSTRRNLRNFSHSGNSTLLGPPAINLSAYGKMFAGMFGMAAKAARRLKKRPTPGVCVRSRRPKSTRERPRKSAHPAFKFSRHSP